MAILLLMNALCTCTVNANSSYHGFKRNLETVNSCFSPKHELQVSCCIGMDLYGYSVVSIGIYEYTDVRCNVVEFLYVEKKRHYSL